MDKCGRCSGDLLKSVTDTEFPYGSGAEMVYLPITVTVFTCPDCDDQFLDSEAEVIRDIAIKKHLESLEKKLEILK